jgi:hypothetical protein
MTVVAAGSRVLLRTANGVRALRTLRDVTVEPGSGVSWFLPVVAEVDALALGPGTAELPTPDGVLQVQVALEGQGGRLGLRPVAPPEGPLLQRRGDVRSSVSVPVRGALLPDGPLNTRPAPLSGDGARRADLQGVTIDASGGGIAATVAGRLLDAGVADEASGGNRPIVAGSRLYVEFDLPDGRGPVTAVAVVVLQRGPLLRARFHDITPADRERLVRVVFAQHRDELRERRNALDAGRRPGD